MSKYWRTYVLIGVALCIFLIPNLFWGNLYIVGGDDARLYYLYPFEYLKNFSFNVMSGNTLGGNLGYTPVSYSAPIIACIWFLKTLLPLVNTQLLIYGLIFSLGFIFFYLLIQELAPRKSPFYFWSGITASLAYMLSLYITRTYFQSQFISIFLLMVLPGCLFLFVSGLKKKSASRVVAASLLYSMFGASIYGFPWLLPVLLTLIPFIAYLAFRYGWYFWKMTAVFLCIFFFCNLYWIIHFLIPVLNSAGEANYIAAIASSTFAQSNNELITSMVYLNSPVHQIAQYLRISWEDRQGISLLQSLGVIYLSIIIGAGIILRRVKKDVRILYLVSSAGLLLAILFETPNLGAWNLQIFQFLNTHIPFFVIFRNMYDKFALAMAFHYAFTLWISLAVLHQAKGKRLYVYVLLLVVLSVTIFRFIPYVRPDYKETDFSTRISGLNQDFTDLTRYIQNMNTTFRFVWYPLTFGDYVYINDQTNPGHYYVGVSPLQIFARASDLAGFYGLQTPGEPELHWKVLSLLQQGRFTEVGNIFRQQNAGYVIVNNDPVPRNGTFIVEQFDFVKSQNEEYKDTILGTKIRDFGKRYSLYEINQELMSPTVSLNGTEIPFRRDADGVYDIGPFAVSDQSNLYLMEPYSRLWSLKRTDVGKHSSVEGPNTLAYGYGNSWYLDPERIGTPTVRLRAEFWPNRLIVPSLIFSIASVIIAGLYIVVMWVKKLL